MPRMTDSMAHQAGPGPSSLKLAALSANSYHLDSPPFTGTAGPLGDTLAEEHSERFNNLHDLSISGDQTPAASGRRGGGESSRERALMEGSSSRHQHTASNQVMQEGLNERNELYAHNNQTSNGDVPRWHLDDPRHQQQSRTIPGKDTEATPGVTSPHVISHSLSPPPFSSAGQGPLSAASTMRGGMAPSAHVNIDAAASERRGAHSRERSRPYFTQISDASSASYEESSSAAADGDADADESLLEAEVDGDETAHMARIPSNGSANKVPTQSQTKVRHRYKPVEARESTY
jgi:hypothetical protein